jgi:hypothetical protein
MSNLEVRDHIARPLITAELERICELSDGKGLTMAMVFDGMQERGYVAALNDAM